MAAEEDAARVMTVEAWRALERASHDVKHEYIDGHVYAMSGGSLSHGRIGSNAVRALEDALSAVGDIVPRSGGDFEAVERSNSSKRR